MSETSFYQRFHIKRFSRLMTRIKEKTSIHFRTKSRTSLFLESPADSTREIIQVKKEEEPNTLASSLKYSRCILPPTPSPSPSPSLPLPLPPLSPPQISSLPPPPRYTQKYRHKSAHLKDAQNLIQTRSSFIATLAPPAAAAAAEASTSKPYLCRSNTLGHPSTPNISPLGTPDQPDHTSPISTASEIVVAVDYFKLQDDQVSLLQRWRNNHHHYHNNSYNSHNSHNSYNSCNSYKSLSAPEDAFSLELLADNLDESPYYEKTKFDTIVSTPLSHTQPPSINVISPNLSRTPSLINFPDSPSSSISHV